MLARVPALVYTREFARVPARAFAREFVLQGHSARTSTLARWRMYDVLVQVFISSLRTVRPPVAAPICPAHFYPARQPLRSAGECHVHPFATLA